MAASYRRVYTLSEGRKEGDAVRGGGRNRRRSMFSLGYLFGVALVVLVIVLLILAITD
jgi:hypothetical protein